MNRASVIAAFLALSTLGCVTSLGPADPNGIGNGTGVSTGGGGGGTVPLARQVTVSDGFFSPASLTVAVGDTVQWNWSGNGAHTVTFGDGHDSGARNSGFFRRGFSAAGTYSYRSRLPADSLMTGQVVVQ